MYIKGLLGVLILIAGLSHASEVSLRQQIFNDAGQTPAFDLRSCQTAVTGKGRTLELCRVIPKNSAYRFITFDVFLHRTYKGSSLPKVGLWIEAGGVGSFYDMKVTQSSEAGSGQARAVFYLSSIPFRLNAGFLLEKAWDEPYLEFSLVVDGEWDSDFGKNYRVYR